MNEKWGVVRKRRQRGKRPVAISLKNGRGLKKAR
jgi:hypothetical protein